MSDIRDFQTRPVNAAGVRTDVDIDQGLRAHMLKVYNLMALGVALTGLVAWFVSRICYQQPGDVAQLTVQFAAEVGDPVCPRWRSSVAELWH